MQAFFSISLSCTLRFSSVSGTGFRFGIEKMCPYPEAAAARLPLAMVSLKKNPGSRKCTCTSTKEGIIKNDSSEKSPNLFLYFSLKRSAKFFFIANPPFGHKKILPSGKITVIHNTLAQAPVLRASAVCLPMSILPTSLYRA